MKNQNSPVPKSRGIRLSRRSPAYWRVTFDHPPLNVFGPEGILEMAEIITALETDKHVKVVVFDSAVEGFFLNHSDFLGKLEDLTGLDRFASLAGYPCAADSRICCVDSFDSRAGDWQRK